MFVLFWGVFSVFFLAGSCPLDEDGSLMALEGWEVEEEVEIPCRRELNSEDS